MNINKVSTDLIKPLADDFIDKLKTVDDVTGENANFADILSQALNNVAATDSADKASAVELLAGEADDMSGLLLDAQKAEISLSLALSIRNKALDAYNEIMRMSL